MGSNKKKSEKELFEQFRVALTNATVQTEIATVMAEYTYDATKIAEGQSLWDNVSAAYSHMSTESDETTEASNAFKIPRAKLEKQFAVHREKAKFLFRNDAVIADMLQVNKKVPRAYVAWLEMVKKFYIVIMDDTDIQAKFATFKTSLEELTAANSLVTDVENARTEYLREAGESQDATKSKDAALAALEIWMHDFYDVARIALRDRPQLLESLGLFVRS